MNGSSCGSLCGPVVRNTKWEGRLRVRPMDCTVKCDESSKCRLSMRHICLWLQWRTQNRLGDIGKLIPDGAKELIGILERGQSIFGGVKLLDGFSCRQVSPIAEKRVSLRGRRGDERFVDIALRFIIQSDVVKRSGSANHDPVKRFKVRPNSIGFFTRLEA